MAVQLLPGAVRRIRAAGSVNALLRLTSTDSLGDVAVLWERVTLRG